MRQQVAGPASRVRMKYCRASWSGWNEAREAIHPFTDGNGRRGRILNILCPVEQGLPDLTVLYLSYAFIRSKDRYYEGLRGMTAEGGCADWVLCMLETLRETADATRRRILQIRDLMGGPVLMTTSSTGSGNVSICASLLDMSWQSVADVASMRASVDRERCIFPSLRGKGRLRWTDRPGLRPLRDEGERCRVLGDAQLKLIAQELVESIRRNVTIDWTVKENVRARLRVMVKRILRKYGYPPDLQETATQMVIEQAEVLCADWAA